MKNGKSKIKTKAHDESFKGELVPEKDPMDHDMTGRYMKRNPYKTPPNNITSKDK